MFSEVYVTGMGIISSVGSSVDETLVSLKAEKSGLGNITLFDTQLAQIPVCEVKLSNDDLLDRLSISHDRDLYTRTALLGLTAAREAMRSSHSRVPASRISLVSATTVGGMDFNERHYETMNEGKLAPKYIEMLDCADATQRIAANFGIYANVGTVSTACSSSANAIMIGARMIRNGLADKVLVGGSDCQTRFALNGFNTLEILSPTGCKPFDAERNGVTLGEGAAFLVLESEKTALPDDIICRLSGFANTCEAYHQTASSPDGEGAIHAIRQALNEAQLASQDINYINAHGTGTLVNDLSEGRAIETVFGGQIPPVSSTKGYTGHTLAAAGAVEAVISILSLTNNVLFPNIRFETQMPELAFSPVMTIQKGVEIKHVLSNS
ncbi:MAG: beta-ketoacyl-[acyl-carrier-protein] synthase family protein, partial [Prevotellaceae bacterium]|nr:beta-ketoacyl-[acyl-carrier-protein] synthase family protein [Prevotellaceae bacterium]